MKNKFLLVGAVVLLVGWLLWKLNQQTRLKENYQDEFDRARGY